MLRLVRSLRNLKEHTCAQCKPGAKEALGTERGLLLHLLEVQGDPHTVDQNNALIDQLLVRNVRICKFPYSSDRTHELYRFGRVPSSSSQVIQNSDVETAKFCVIRNAFKD